MTNRLDLDTRLARYLADEAPPRAPERLIDTTRRGLLGTPQRRRHGIVPWRWSAAMPWQAGWVAAVLLIAIGAALLVGRSGPSVGVAPPVSPSPSPAAPSASPSGSPSASPSTAASPCPSGQGSCLGQLQPGTYTSSTFQPAVRYTVPGGWMNTLDVRGELDLSYGAGGQYRYPDGLTFHDGISIFRRPVAESTASFAPQAGIGTTAGELAAWLAAHPDLVASDPTPVTIGGASGQRLTLSLPTGTRTAPDHCTTDHGEPRCASLFLSSDPDANYGFGLVGPESVVVFLLDLPSAETVMVVIDDVDGVDQPMLEAAAMPIVNSLSFSP
jgi:hypothetical protein